MNSWLASAPARKLLRLRYALLGTLTVVLLVAHTGHGRGGRHLFANGARGLFGARGLHVYGNQSNLVMGSIGLVVVRTLDALGGYVTALIVVGGTGLFLVWARSPLWPLGAFLSFKVLRPPDVGNVALSIRLAYAATALIWTCNGYGAVLSHADDS